MRAFSFRLLVACAMGGLTACSQDSSIQEDIVRFVRVVEADRASGAREGKRLPAMDWSLIGGSGTFAVRESVFHINAGDAPVTITIPVDISAGDYTALRLRMRAERGQYCRIQWLSSIESEYREAVSIKAPIYTGNRFHTYKIRLRSALDPIWLGEITELALTPSNEAGSIEIIDAELIFEENRLPQPVTIEGVTREAFFGSRGEIRFKVPETAQFETYVGMGEKAWEDERSDGVEFVARLHPKKGEPVELFRKVLNPAEIKGDRTWYRLESDLSEYAGQTVSLSFEVLPRENQTADYAFWGGPMVYRRSGDPEMIPVILISNDTLRADHVGAYGYERDTTPNIDAFREDAVLFENAIAQETYTLPSHMTMFTGLDPAHHGVTPQTGLNENVRTLTQRLRDIGYITAGFTGFRWWLRPAFGFARGFDVYDTPTPHVRSIEETISHVGEWLAAHSMNNIFVFFHNYDIHAKEEIHWRDVPLEFKYPYFPGKREDLHFSLQMETPELFKSGDYEHLRGETFLKAMTQGNIAYDEKDVDFLKALYDDGIRYTDSILGEALAALRREGIYENALILITADHGEEFNEHGFFGHHQVYEEIARVPLLIKFPRNAFAGKTVTSVVQLADLYPTILDVLGQPIPTDLDGQSLLAILEGRESPRDYGFSRLGGTRSFRKGKWKILVGAKNVKQELYDLETDPGEQENLVRTHPDKFRQMAENLERFHATSQEGWHILVHAGANRETRVDMLVESDNSLANFNVSWGDDALPLDDGLDSAGLSEDERTLKAHFYLPWRDRDELVLIPAGDSHRIHLELRSDQRFKVVVGDKFPVSVESFRAVLDPSEKDYPKPEEQIRKQGRRPTVFVWYTAPTPAGPAMAEPSEEEKELLRALGYLGSSQP